MAHFAQIIGNTVTQVIVVSNEDVDNLDYPESEPLGQTFIASLGLSGQWLQTSYNATFRAKFAGIGDTYDSILDVFVGKSNPDPQ